MCFEICHEYFYMVRRTYLDKQNIKSENKSKEVTKFIKPLCGSNFLKIIFLYNFSTIISPKKFIFHISHKFFSLSNHIPSEKFAFQKISLTRAKYISSNDLWPISLNSPFNRYSIRKMDCKISHEHSKWYQEPTLLSKECMPKDVTSKWELNFFFLNAVFHNYLYLLF